VRTDHRRPRAGQQSRPQPAWARGRMRAPGCRHRRMAARTRGATLTSTDHYLEVERLLEHAASMLNTDVHPQDRVDFVAREAVIVAMASAHAAVADAAVAGLSVHLDTADTQAWRGGSPRHRWAPSVRSTGRAGAHATAPNGSLGYGTRRRDAQVRDPAPSGQDHSRMASTTRSLGPGPHGCPCWHPSG
jgi:hypothetical protein